MKFNTVREMETELKKVTSLRKLQEDITFASQGKFITLEYIGTGASAKGKEVSYIGGQTADSLRIAFDGNGDTITVTEVKTTRA